MVSATTPYGNIANPLNPTTLALSYETSFVGRIFSKLREHSSQIILQAMQHKGFSLVHLLTPCVEFNKFVTYKSIDENILAEDHG